MHTATLPPVECKTRSTATLGDRIDRFTLVRQLGAGGMGATWEAVRQASHEFEQRVAIKLANPELLNTTDGLTSFRREAALAASLRHPNIAAVLDIDERAGYIVCELVDGADLRAVLRAAPGGRLMPEVAVHVLGQIARGLSHAHRRILRGRPSPVIHRDMSPGNVVIDYDGNVKIVDFGIAQVMVSGSEVSETVKGKLAYMSPEQAMGHRTDGRADQYAVGVIAYEALSGVRPNDGNNDSETLACILGGRHIPLAQRVTNLPEKLGVIVERMLARRPEQRFASMDAVLDALSELTPSLTTYRDLVPLVIAARQPHTILSENGRFVSRPVEADPVLMGMPQSLPAPPLAPSPAPLPRIERRPTVPTVPDPSLPPARPLTHALASTVDETRPRRLPPAMPIPSNRVHSLANTAVADPGMLDLRPSQPAPRASHPPPAPRERVWVSRLFWQTFSVAGALVLGFVLWSAFFPDSLGFLSGMPGASVVRPRAPEPSSPDGRAGQELLDAVTITAAAPGASTTDPAQLRARARVRVSPRGQVWVDGELRGAAAPSLELSLTPGEHVVAVGRNSPTQTRTVLLGAGESELVFDLAGK